MTISTQPKPHNSPQHNNKEPQRKEKAENFWLIIC